MKTLQMAKKGNLTLYRPSGGWDMNYSVIDDNSNLEYLIDIGDVMINDEEIEEYGGILFSDLKQLDLEQIQEVAWKVIDLSKERV